MTLGEAARTLVFWVLSIAFFVGNFATAAVSVHLIPFLGERGYSATLAAAIIGWMGAMQVPGRLLFVPISARLGARWMVASVFFGQAVGLGLIPLIVLMGTAVPFIIVMGASNGMSTLSRATSLARIFGPRHYGAIARERWLSAPTAPARWGRWAPPCSCSASANIPRSSGRSPPRWWVVSLAVLAAGAGVDTREVASIFIAGVLHSILASASPPQRRAHPPQSGVGRAYARGSLLVGVAQPEHRRFVEGTASQLHAEGKAARRESARHGEHRQAEGVEGPGEAREATHAPHHVLRRPGFGVGEGERRLGNGGGHEDVHLGEHLGDEVTGELRAQTRSLQVVIGGHAQSRREPGQHRGLELSRPLLEDA